MIDSNELFRESFLQSQESYEKKKLQGVIIASL